MKGILPWIREALFGPAKPKCNGYTYCKYTPLPDCISGGCAEHCRRDCKCGAAPLHEYGGRKRCVKNLKRKKDFDWPEDLGI